MHPITRAVLIGGGITLIAFIVGALALASGHCGGRGCINQFPSPAASVTR